MKRRMVVVLVLLGLGAGAGVILASKISRRMADEQLRGALVSAEALLRQDKSKEAALALAPWRDRAARGDLGERRLALDMKALAASGQTAPARKTAEAYLKEFPKGKAVADAEFLRLRPDLEADPTDPDLRERADALLARYPAHPEAARIQTALARAEMKAGRIEEARERLLAVWEAGPSDAQETAIADLLGEINLTLLFDPRPQPGDKVEKVAPGRYLYHIARDAKLPMELLLAVNRVKDATKMSEGQAVRIPSVQFSLVCDKAANTLTLYNQGRFFKRYVVRTGRTPDSTPTGEFKILNKKTDPTWRYDGKVYKPGDPANELGTRWMAFQGDTLGIHGTIRPETIGHYASNGCIGMLKGDVEELFDLIPTGTPLRIVGQQNLAKHRVIADEGRRVASASTNP